MTKQSASGFSGFYILFSRGMRYESRYKSIKKFNQQKCVKSFNENEKIRLISLQLGF